MKLKSLVFLGLATIGIIYSATIPAANNAWDVLRHEFKLDHEIHHAEVQQQIRWILNHPSYLQQLAQAQPYLYHIITEIKKRHLPGELALIPMIESAYDPFAYSDVGAAGLWQLMPATGHELGLKQDWWLDARRSIGLSTDAALNYLLYLNHVFHGNWSLTFAAYDAGKGTVSHAIKNSHQLLNKANFWSLSLPKETKLYIPRLMALAEIIQNPEHYHAKLPHIPSTPYFEEVNIGSQIDLNHAAKLAGISYADLIKLNPGYNHWATAPYKPFKLLIPKDHVQNFNKNLAKLPINQRVSLKAYETTAVKKPQFKDPKIYKTIHIVQKEENLNSIKQQYQVAKEDIKQWNHLKTNQPIKTGQSLIIWKVLSPRKFYVVKTGDSLKSIAQKNHTSITHLLAQNPNLKQHVMYQGQRIFLS